MWMLHLLLQRLRSVASIWWLATLKVEWHSGFTSRLWCAHNGFRLKGSLYRCRIVTAWCALFSVRWSPLWLLWLFEHRFSSRILSTSYFINSTVVGLDYFSANDHSVKGFALFSGNFSNEAGLPLLLLSLTPGGSCCSTYFVSCWIIIKTVWNNLLRESRWGHSFFIWLVLTSVCQSSVSLSCKKLFPALTEASKVGACRANRCFWKVFYCGNFQKPSPQPSVNVIYNTIIVCFYY